MSVVIYKLETPSGATIESENEQDIKDRKESLGGVITAYDMSFRVQNDPIPQFYETGDLAAARVEELRAMYEVVPIKTLISPQPEGLND